MKWGQSPFYLYETHMHTSEGSACGEVAGADYIDFMKALGYSGMIVTDHFFNGNCAVDNRLPWEARVREYVKGYEHAKAAAEGKDFDVLFGVEFNFEGDEYLIYGIDEEWIIAHPEIMDMTRQELHTAVHDAGAIMVQAHPYRERCYLSDIRLTPDVCDGVEIYNASNSDNENALAYQYAKKLGVPVTGGSDIHYFNRDMMGGMVLPRRISDTKEFVQILMDGEAVPVMFGMKDKNYTPVESVKALQEPTAKPTVEIKFF